MKILVKMISVTIIILSLISNVAFAKVIRVIDIPRVSVDQTEISKLDKMTLEELKSIAKPAPPSALSTETDEFGTSQYIKTDSLLTLDNNVYEITYSIEFNWKDGTNFKNYYRLLYLSPSELDTVTYHVYTWGYVNDQLFQHGEYAANFVDPDLYKIVTDEWKKQHDPGRSASSGTQGNQDSSTQGSQGSSNTTGNNGSTSNNSDKSYTKKRLYGKSRQETSKIIAEEFNSGTVENVILATGNNYPDALAGSVLAKKLNAPILLTGEQKDNAAALDYIQNHLTTDGTIYILGGQGAVSEDVVSSLKAMDYQNIKRLNGDGRYETCKAINDELNVTTGTPVVITTGRGFADALSISSVAAAKGYPIVLTEKDNLSAASLETLKKVQPSQVYIIGGTSAISDSLKDQIANLTGLSTDKVVRISGDGRYTTSLNIAKYFQVDSDTVIFATGNNFPDALAGSVLAAKYNAPIILVGGNVTAQKLYIDSSKYSKVITLGGTGAVSNEIEQTLTE